jgi:hypothetical protein
MLEINWCIEAHGKEGKGGGVHTSSSISKRVKPPNFGSSDGIGGGVWPSTIEISWGGELVSISTSFFVCNLYRS